MPHLGQQGLMVMMTLERPFCFEQVINVTVCVEFFPTSVISLTMLIVL